jgi:hypothetical protein
MTEREPGASTHHPVKNANVFVCAACLARWPCHAVHELIAERCADRGSPDSTGPHDAPLRTECKRT